MRITLLSGSGEDAAEPTITLENRFTSTTEETISYVISMLNIATEQDVVIVENCDHFYLLRRVAVEMVATLFLTTRHVSIGLLTERDSCHKLPPFISYSGDNLLRHVDRAIHALAWQPSPQAFGDVIAMSATKNCLPNPWTGYTSTH